MVFAEPREFFDIRTRAEDVRVDDPVVALRIETLEDRPVDHAEFVAIDENAVIKGARSYREEREGGTDPSQMAAAADGLQTGEDMQSRRAIGHRDHLHVILDTDHRAGGLLEEPADGPS